MLDRLQQKWKVNGLRVILILCTFAIGGSLTGYAGKKLMNLFDIESSLLWIVIYILIVTLIWPLAVLIISIPFGQYRFFTGYLKKMGKRLGPDSYRVGSRGKPDDLEKARLRTMKSEPDSNRVPVQGFRIAVFASGAGSNAQKIIDHFRDSENTRVALIVCNNPKAGVLNIAARENIPSLFIDKEKFFRGDAFIPELNQHQINFIVLAGFLWKIPDALITAYPNKIINIHPALLPGFGGKGMYGNHVHEAVIAAGEKESGITIHFVDGHYDNGDIIFQAKCPVEPDDTAESLASRIHQLEHAHYPRVIGELLARN